MVDGRNYDIVKKIALSGRPNNISISPDGARVYVGIVSEPGAVDVIDTTSLERVKSIPTKGGIHNVYVTPDGKHVVAGSIAGRLMTVIDAKTSEPLWTLFDENCPPDGVESKPDGSTKRMFVQLSNVHGFAVVDFDQRKEVRPCPMLPERYSRRQGGCGATSTDRRRTASASHRMGRHAMGDEPAEIYRDLCLNSLPDLTLLGAR